MKRGYTKEALKKGGKVLLSGWVERIKVLGKVAFVRLRDKEGSIQLVFNKKELIKKVEKLSNESVISVEGIVKKGELKSGDKEIIVSKIEIINISEVPLPIDIFGDTTFIDKRLDWRYLDTRNPKVKEIFEIRSKMSKLVFDFFIKNGFININTPKITASGVESGSELFEVDYFSKKAYLSQSPQIYKQMFVIGGFEKVFELGPVFRAEKSHTTRHLTEFFGIDMEMGFIKDEHDVMDVVEELMKFIYKGFGKKLSKIPRITMKEAKKYLESKGKKLKKDDDLDAESEKLLGQKYELVFVYNYPWPKRPFYHMKTKDGTRSFDLIWNGVEVGTGAQREHRLDILKNQAAEKKIELDKNYSNIFRFGAPPHGGVGLGLDRMVQCWLKLDNVREAVLCVRDPERLTP